MNTNRFFIIFIFFILSISSVFAQMTVKTTANPDSVCYGTGKVVVLVCKPTGGTPPYKFYWNSGGVTIDTNNVSPPNKSTRYIVSVTDATDFKIVDTVNVYVPTAPPSMNNVPDDISICIGVEKIIKLNSSVGSTVTWKNDNIAIGLMPTGKGSIKFTPTALGDATIFVTPGTSSACIGNTSAFNITVVPLPTIKLPKDTSIVIGDTLTITASGGEKYTWNTGSSQASIDVTPTKVTSYTVTVTSSSGCTASATMKVNVYTKLNIGNIKSSINNISTQKVCEKGTAKISLEATPKGGNNTYKYSWSNSTDSIQTKINEFIQPLKAGTYTYTVTITSGTQKDTASIKINVLKRPQPAIVTQQTNPCIGEKVFYQAIDSSKLTGVIYTWEIEDSLTSNILAWDGAKYSKTKNGNPLWVEWNKTTNTNLKVTATGESCAASSEIFKADISGNTTTKDKGIGFIKTNTIFYYKDSTAKCYQWGYIGENGFTKIDKEIYQAFAPGKTYNNPPRLYAVEICTKNGCPLIATYRENENIPIEDNTKENIILYPNPNNGDFSIKAENLPEENYELKFINILGKELYKEQISAPKGTFFKTFENSNFTSGIYFTVLSSNNKRYKTIKFIVQ